MTHEINHVAICEISHHNMVWIKDSSSMVFLRNACCRGFSTHFSIWANLARSVQSRVGMVNNSTASLRRCRCLLFSNCLTMHTSFASTSSTKILMGCHHRNLNSDNIRQAGRSAIRSKRNNKVMTWCASFFACCSWNLKHPTKRQASTPCLKQLI